MARSVDELAQRLNSATVHLMRALRQDRPPSGLAAEHSSALGVVVFAGPMSIGALARAERVGAPAMTKTVSILESGGLVTRERDPSDARVVRVRATRKANELVLRGRDERVVRIGEALATFSPAEALRLKAAIGTFERLVKDLEAAALRERAEPRRARSASLPSSLGRGLQAGHTLAPRQSSRNPRTRAAGRTASKGR